MPAAGVAAARLRRLLGPLLLLAAAAYLYRAAGDIPVVPVPGQLGPGFWPRLALVGLALACAVKLVTLWRTPAAPSAARAAPRGAAGHWSQEESPAPLLTPSPAGGRTWSPGDEEGGRLTSPREDRGGGESAFAAALDEAPPAVDWRTLALAVLWLGLYVAASPLVGFALANTLFLIGFMWLGGLRRPLVGGALAVGLTVGCLYLFVKVVYLPLPRGAGVFLDATLALYRLLGLF